MFDKTLRELSVVQAYYKLLENREVICIDDKSLIEYKLVKTFYQKDYVIATLNDIEIELQLQDITLYLIPRPKVFKYIYLMEDVNYLKIGKSDKPLDREKCLTTGNATILLNSWYKSKNATEEEKILHKRFEKFKVRGEWFQKDPSIFLHFNTYSRFLTDYFYPNFRKDYSKLPLSFWNLIENYQLIVKKSKRGLRLQNLCDIWYSESIVNDIVTHSKVTYKDENELINAVKDSLQLK